VTGKYERDSPSTEPGQAQPVAVRARSRGSETPPPPAGNTPEGLRVKRHIGRETKRATRGTRWWLTSNPNSRTERPRSLANRTVAG
jgi:hypothetical protein